MKTERQRKIIKKIKAMVAMYRRCSQGKPGTCSKCIGCATKLD